MTPTQFRHVLDIARVGLAEVAKDQRNAAEIVAELATAISEGKKHLLSWEATEAGTAAAPVSSSANSG